MSVGKRRGPPLVKTMERVSVNARQLFCVQRVGYANMSDQMVSALLAQAAHQLTYVKKTCTGNPGKTSKSVAHGT